MDDEDDQNTAFVDLFFMEIASFRKLFTDSFIDIYHWAIEEPLKVLLIIHMFDY